MEFFNLENYNELAYYELKERADKAYAEGKKLKARRLYRKYAKESFKARGVYDKI